MATPLASLHLAENAEKHVAGWSAGDVPLGDVMTEGTQGAVYTTLFKHLGFFCPGAQPHYPSPTSPDPKCTDTKAQTRHTAAPFAPFPVMAEYRLPSGNTCSVSTFVSMWDRPLSLLISALAGLPSVPTNSSKDQGYFPWMWWPWKYLQNHQVTYSQRSAGILHVLIRGNQISVCPLSLSIYI